MNTRMIERWFPCAEVTSQSHGRGWGSGFAEKSLFTWFASRPLAQAKAAVICSLLPWPEDPREQSALKALVRKAMTGYDVANAELRSILDKQYPDGAKMCDPFSGRAMIPLEAARLGVKSWGIDYSPVATVAGRLLADYPMRNWSNEPHLPFDEISSANSDTPMLEPKLLRDVRLVLDTVGVRFTDAMSDFYPEVAGKRPWGYVWSVTLPCANCGAHFPLTGKLDLRKPNPKRNDAGQSYRIAIDAEAGTFTTVVHEGPPLGPPVLVKSKGRQGRVAVCCFCQHVHSLSTQRRMMSDGISKEVMLVVADLDSDVGKHYRLPLEQEDIGAAKAIKALEQEPHFGNGLPAVPNEPIDPGLSNWIAPVGYGYTSYGDLCNPRQTLGFVKLARIIDNMYNEVIAAGASQDYATALTNFTVSNLARRLRRSTRSSTLLVNEQAAGDIYLSESSIAHSFDYFETGCGHGPGTWWSFATQTCRYLERQFSRIPGKSAVLDRGTATNMPFPNGHLDAVVTDPPYDAMINYCDSSDLIYVWLKRALVSSDQWFGMTTDPDGLQEKSMEAVIKKKPLKGARPDHRTSSHYVSCITRAFRQARLKTNDDGVVSIVFGHGDPEAWIRVLSAISDAGLILTGSWPASTEKSGKKDGEYIDNTIMMACRAAAASRPVGDVRVVDQEVRAEIARRVRDWTADGLADSDQRMAAIAPAMEVVGRYSAVRDFTGEPVPIRHFLGLAHQAVEEAADVRIDQFKLTDFDNRTRFSLAWARQHGRRVAAASEARWQRLSYDMDDDAVQGIVVKANGGTRMAFGHEASSVIDLQETSPVIDVALAVAGADRSVSDIAGGLHLIQRENDDMLWAAIAALSRYVGEGDCDGQQWAWAVRNRNEICERALSLRSDHEQRVKENEAREAQLSFFE